MTALALVFSKIVSEDKRSMTIFIQVIFNEIDIHDLFESVYSTIIRKHTKVFREIFKLDY